MFDLQINYDRLDYSKFSDKRDDFGIPLNLNLPYNKNNLIFHFDAVSLGNRRGVRFQYYLKGLSDEWSPLSATPSFPPTNISVELILYSAVILPPGSPSSSR